MSKVALLSGTTGQDGSYLTELLLSKDYYVWGIVRKSSASNKMQNIEHLLNHPKLFLKYGDLSDSNCVPNLLTEIKNKYPDLERLEIYNLGAITNVKLSFEMPDYTCEVNAKSVLRMLEAIRQSGYSNIIRLYNASTSELFGKVVETPQTENTPFYPRSPYGVAKLYAYWITKNYRESYGLFACNGVLYNHDSPRRDEIFLTRKVTKCISDILHGRTDKLVVGNINPFRDISHASDMVRGMWQILQQDEADDYVLSSNETHSIREFIEKAFAIKNFDIKWKGEGLNEIGYDANTGRELIFISKEFFRPAEVDLLLGDSRKAREKLGWKPTISFDELIKEMVENDCKS